ncbi:helix-turn-helix domain-containing protein [Actinokineospora sp. NPDC004072]
MDRPPASSPRVERERLAELLRKLRERSGLNQAEVAARTGWSMSKVQRAETAVVSISAKDTQALLDVYEVADPELARRMLAMAKASRRRDSFTPYKRFFSAEYQDLLSYEESATAIRSLNCFGLPGLLQTQEYARALLSVKHSGPKLDALVEARAVRQRILAQPGAPTFEFIVDEALLHRQVGGRAALARQLDHLRRAARRPTTALRVLPFGADAHLGHWEQFLVIDVPGDAAGRAAVETIVYREIGESEQLVRGDADRIAEYEAGYAAAAAQALGVADSLDVLDRLRRRLDDPAEAARPLPR